MSIFNFFNQSQLARGGKSGKIPRPKRVNPIQMPTPELQQQYQNKLDAVEEKLAVAITEVEKLDGRYEAKAQLYGSGFAREALEEEAQQSLESYRSALNGLRNFVRAKAGVEFDPHSYLTSQNVSHNRLIESCIKYFPYYDYLKLIYDGTR